MFTGIIHHTATLLSTTPTATGLRLTLANPFATDPDPLRLGDSIATDGVCLTIAAMDPGQLHFDAIPETLAKTNLGTRRPNDKLHLERALRFGDRLDGHLVQGHVDATAELLHISTRDSERRLTLRAPADLAKYLTPKGSAAIDGVSLTLADVRGADFDLTLIPTTLSLTTLGTRKPGYRFNLEVDATVKTIVQSVERLRLSI